MTTTDNSFTALIEGVRAAAARAKSGTLSPEQATDALVQAGEMIAALDLRAFPMGNSGDDAREQVTMRVHSVDLMIRGRLRGHGKQEVFVHVTDERDTDEIDGEPLVVEVNHAGEHEYR